MSCVEITPAQKKKNIYKHTKSGRSKAMEFSHIMRNTKFDLTRKNVDCSIKYIYLVGGDENGAINSVEKYDGQIWSNEPNMITPRYNHNVIVYKGLLYSAGGRNGTGTLTSVETYNGVSWSNIQSMTRARETHGMVVYNDNIYVIGGDGINSLEQFNGINWTSSATNIPTTRFYFSVCVYNNYIYVLGGANSGLSMNIVEAYNGTTWTNTTPMIKKRRAFSSVVYKGRLFAIGGLDSDQLISQSTKKVEAYDGSTWTYVADMNIDRYDHESVVYNGKIYVIGGFTGGNVPLYTIEVYDGVGWTTLPASQNISPKKFFKATVYNK
jgi:hypothetical protein